MKLALRLSTLLAFSACSPPEAIDGVLGDSWLFRGGCDDWHCGSNSPKVGHELHPDEFNTSGFRIVPEEISQFGSPVHIEVHGDRLMAYHSPHGPALTNLVGLQIPLEDALTGKIQTIELVEVGQTQMWVAGKGDRPPMVPTYKFEYLDCSDPQGCWVCPDDGGNTTTLATHEKTRKHERDRDDDPLLYTALIFNGDRYDAATKTVSLGDPWMTRGFNIACRGSAIQKIHLMGRTTAAARRLGPGHETNQAEHQALLNAVTATYCHDDRNADGTHEAFTVEGQQLRYLDERGWIDRNSGNGFWPGVPAGFYEAVWTEKGAACLNTPRMTGLDERRIIDECGALPPRCTTHEPEYFTEQWLDVDRPFITYVPK